MSKFKLKPLNKEAKKEFSQVRLYKEINNKFVMIAKGFGVSIEDTRNSLIEQMMEGKTEYELQTPTCVVVLEAPLSNITEEYIEEFNLRIRQEQEKAKATQSDNQGSEEIESEVEDKEGFDSFDPNPEADEDDEEIKW